VKLNRQYLIESILEAMEEDDFFVQKFAGLLKAAPDREHMHTAIDLFDQLRDSMEPESLSRLSILFLDRILDLYNTLSFDDIPAAKKELKEIDKLRDRFVSIYYYYSEQDKLPPEQFEKYAKSYVISSDNPGKDLLEIGYDFHSIFEKAFGFSPPRSKEFKMSGEELTLKVALPGGSEEKCLKDAKFVYDDCIEYLDYSESDESCEDNAEGTYRDCRENIPMSFEFWYDMHHGFIIEPWFRFETMHGFTGDVSINDSGAIELDDGPTFKGEEISKEKLPGALRSSMGIPWDAETPEWPELPKGQPPAEGSDVKAPVDPPYEGKRKLDKNFLFEVINEVLQETEEHELSEKQKIENMIRSNNGEDFVWGLEMCNMLACSAQVPQIINSQVMSGKYAGNDWVFLLVKTEKEAQDLHWYLRAMRPKSSMPSRKNKGAYMFYWPASEGSPFRVNIDMEHEEGDYIVEIVLDLPDYEMTSWGSVRWLQENLIREDEEEDPYEQISNKIDAFIGSNNLGHYNQGFHIIEVYEMSDLISKEQGKELREKMWLALWDNELYSKDTIDDIIEMIEDDTTLDKEFKFDMEHNVYYYGSYLESQEWALEYALKSFDLDIETIDPENLSSIGGGDQELLEKAKQRLLDFGEEEDHFEWDIETGRLLYGILARPYVEFEKKVEEIFGATPMGDVFFGGIHYNTVSKKTTIDEPFEAPMVDGIQVTADIMFEWNPESQYGMEITLVPAKLPNHPGILEDYYGIWVSTVEEGPSKGMLEIGIQSYEDELADNKLVQNNKGTYGFSREEMKEKILELTGIDLNAIN